MKIAVIGVGRVGEQVRKNLSGFIHHGIQMFPGYKTVACPKGYDVTFLQGCDAAVICTPFTAILAEATKAVNAGVRAIFSCTEDWETGFYLKRLPVHVEPHCGLAPGFVGDLAHETLKRLLRLSR